ncbi:MAG: hypothetical protein ABI995_06755 [Acidobacteriota bacterium]
MFAEEDYQFRHSLWITDAVLVVCNRALRFNMARVLTPKHIWQGCDPSADASPEWMAVSLPPPSSARRSI